MTNLNNKKKAITNPNNKVKNYMKTENYRKFYYYRQNSYMELVVALKNRSSIPCSANSVRDSQSRKAMQAFSKGKNAATKICKNESQAQT